MARIPESHRPTLAEIKYAFRTSEHGAGVPRRMGKRILTAVLLLGLGLSSPQLFS